MATMVEQTPIAVRFGCAGRYATALLELAQQQGQLEPIAAAAEQLASWWQADAAARAFFSSPLVGRGRQEAGLRPLIEKLPPLLGQFLLVVCRNGRLVLLPEMLRAVAAGVAQQRGEVAVRVQSAVPLDETMRQRLLQELAALAPRLRLEVETRPDLLGGLVVQIGSRRIDTSLQGKLEQLSRQWKGAA